MAALLAKALALAVLIHAPCPGVTYPTACAIAPNTIYLPDDATRGDLHHELGHVIDYNLLTDADRGTFKYLTRDRRPWRSPPNSPHEHFAEAVRLCARSPRWVSHYRLDYGYAPTLAAHRRVCRWLVGVGARP